jgi:outer membrane protein insertion porin family
VDVLSEPGEGGVRLVIRVEENPSVHEVRYEGRDKVKEKDLDEKIGVKAGDVLSGNALWKAGESIRAVYREKGYLLAEVSPGTVPIDEGRVDVLFRIKEGRKVHVKTITIRGAKRFHPGDIEKVMKTKEDNWRRSGEFKQDVYEEDLKLVEAYLKDHGYADGHVVADSVWTAENGRDITIDIEIDEGPFYQFGSITASGSTLLSAERMVGAMRIRTGDPYNEQKLQDGMSNVYALFAEEGYIYASLQPERTKREGKIDVALAAVDGPPAHVNKILITGNRKTKERVIRRELVIYPGDLFRRSAILRSQREVFQLGFFEDVQLRDENVRGTNDINLTFEVVEKTTGEATMGAGFSSQTGATGFVRLGESNFAGNGQRASILWEFGGLTQIELSFTEPWLFGSRTTAGADVAVVRRNLDTFYDYRRGGGVRLGRPIPWLDYSRVDWGYRLEWREIQARGGASQAVIDAEGRNLSSSMRVSFTRSSTDRPVHPTMGSFATVRTELAGGPLGGDIDYLQNEFESRWYFPSWWRFVLGLRGRVGVVEGLDSPDEVPLDERYRLGGTGPYGLRGYGDRDVVPQGNPVDVGGRSMVVFTAEYKFPVVQSIYGLFFCDAGNTWNSFSEVRLGELKRGAGFGVRFEIPLLGQLGFDFAYGFDNVDGFGHTDPGWEPHFQLGSMF